eukprot:gene5791-2484_t
MLSASKNRNRTPSSTVSQLPVLFRTVPTETCHHKKKESTLWHRTDLGGCQRMLVSSFWWQTVRSDHEPPMKVYCYEVADAPPAPEDVIKSMPPFPDPFNIKDHPNRLKPNKITPVATGLSTNVVRSDRGSLMRTGRTRMTTLLPAPTAEHVTATLTQVSSQ